MATSYYKSKRSNSSKTIIKFKRQIASMLINDERIFELVNNDELKSAEDMMYANLYPFIRVPEAPDEQLNYICYRIYVPKVYSGSTLFQRLVVEFYVISHQGEMKTDEGATRIDLLAEEVEQLFNGYTGLGKKPIELISNEEDGCGSNHRCRILRFEAEDVDACGS